MATPRRVAADLKRTAAKLAKITDPIVAGAADVAIANGLAAGGRFAGRSGGRGGRPLTVVIRSQSNRKGSSQATVAGKTAGAWSIKSYGRTGGYTVRPSRRRRRRALDLRRAGTTATAAASTVPGSTTGDDRWNRLVVEPTRDAIRPLALDLIDEVI